MPPDAAIYDSYKCFNVKHALRCAATSEAGRLGLFEWLIPVRDMASIVPLSIKDAGLDGCNIIFLGAARLIAVLTALMSS